MEEAKEYYAKIKKEIEPHKDVVYYVPMREEEVLEMEEKWELKFRPIFRQFLLEFGVIQDLVKKLDLDIEDMEDNIDWLRSIDLDNLIPIKTKLTKDSDIIVALNNDPKGKDNIYEVEFGWDEKLKKVKKTKKTFSEIINKAVKKLKTKNRVSNNDKIRVSEFTIYTPRIENLLIGLKGAKITQLTTWEDIYYPENLFGDQNAEFEIFEKVRIEIQRNEMKTKYILEMEEPILIEEQNSLIERVAKMLEDSGLEFERRNYNIIET